MTLKHAAVVVAADDGTSEVGSNEWNADHVIDSEGLTLPTGTATTPAASNVKLHAIDYCGASVLAMKDPTGDDKLIQPHFTSRRVCLISAHANTTTVSANGVTVTTVGTATASAFNPSTAQGRLKKVNYFTAATAGAITSYRSSAAFFNTGDGGGIGGFTFAQRFTVVDAATVAGARMFFGVRGLQTAATNIEPDTIINCVGIAQLSTDATQLYICYGGSSAQTPIALGATDFPAGNSGVPFELCLHSPDNATGVINYQVTNLSNGVKATGQLSGAVAVLPQSATALGFNHFRTNNATALAVGLGVGQGYVETDL